jgi:DNA modification methylase
MKLVKPISTGINALSHTPQYRMHKYFARRPFNVFSNLIEHYSNEDDIVLDLFCGGGVTVFEAISLKRKAIGIDLNPLATFITKMQIYSQNYDKTKENISNFIIKVKERYSFLYQIKLLNDEGFINWLEWAYVVECPHCNAEIVLVEKNKIKNGLYKCQNKDCLGVSGIKRTNAIPKKSIPIRINYQSKKENKTITKAIDDKKEINEIVDFEITHKDLKGLIFPKEKIPIDMDRQFEDKLREKGIIYYSDFYTNRNFKLLTLIFNDILSLKTQVTEHQLDELYFLFSSTLRYSNKMSRVTENWENGNPTSMDKHAFWLPNEYIENNILKILEDRAQAILKGFLFSSKKLPNEIKECKSFSELQNSNNSYLILNQSSTSLPLNDKSVDVIITDPPYGSNVQYAELSIIWNAWFQIYAKKDNFMYRELEAVSNRKKGYKGSKTETDYERLMYLIFSEAYRVLKPDGYLVFTFNNKNIRVWLAMIRAVAFSGFSLPEDGVLFQDYIDSYKNTAHLRFSGNITGDFIYSFKKEANKNAYKPMHNSLIELIDALTNQTISEIFSSVQEISNIQLYKLIFSKLASSITNYIIWAKEYKKPLTELDEFSDDFVSKILERKLLYNNGKWKIKNAQ